MNKVDRRQLQTDLSRQGPPGRAYRVGFTLVELLVVISIISLLLAFLLPALNRAREEAREIVCLSNLHQFNLAAMAYTHGYDDRYPIAYLMAFDSEVFTSYSWDFHTRTDWNQGGEVTVTPGYLWPDETSAAEIHQCPAFNGSSNSLADPYTGYNYNTSYIGQSKGEGIAAPIQFSQVRAPAQCPLFGDGQFGVGANKYMRSPLADPDDPDQGDGDFAARFAGAQGYRHNGATNVAYCDGHVGSVRKRYTNTLDAENLTPDTGFLSPDNSGYDLR